MDGGLERHCTILLSDEDEETRGSGCDECVKARETNSFSCLPVLFWVDGSRKLLVGWKDCLLEAWMLHATKFG